MTYSLFLSILHYSVGFEKSFRKSGQKPSFPRNVKAVFSKFAALITGRVLKAAATAPLSRNF
jgi:hypothetical protein